MSASEGIRRLRQRTTGPKVKATVAVDQIYAHYQHETLYLRHTDGGQAKYLEAPLFDNYAGRIQDFASGLLLIEEESAEQRWGHAVGEPLKDDVFDTAPRENQWLRNSASLRVTVGTKTVMFQPALQRRLTDAEIHSMDQSRLLGDL